MSSSLKNIKNPSFRKAIERDWRRKDGHPCSVWTSKQVEELKKQEKEESEKLNRLLAVKPRKTEDIENEIEQKTRHYYDNDYEDGRISISIGYKEPVTAKSVELQKDIKSYLKKLAILIVFIVLFVGTVLLFPDISKVFEGSGDKANTTKIPQGNITVTIFENDSEDKEIVPRNETRDYTTVCKEKAEEYIRNLVNHKGAFNITLVDIRKFSSPENAENFAKDKRIGLSYYIICRSKLKGLTSTPIEMPQTILAMLYKVEFLGPEPVTVCFPKGCAMLQEFTEIVYCGDDGRLLEKGEKQIC